MRISVYRGGIWTAAGAPFTAIPSKNACASPSPDYFSYLYSRRTWKEHGASCVSCNSPGGGVQTAPRCVVSLRLRVRHGARSGDPTASGRKERKEWHVSGAGWVSISQVCVCVCVCLCVCVGVSVCVRGEPPPPFILRVSVKTPLDHEILTFSLSARFVNTDTWRISQKVMRRHGEQTRPPTTTLFFLLFLLLLLLLLILLLPLLLFLLFPPFFPLLLKRVTVYSLLFPKKKRSVPRIYSPQWKTCARSVMRGASRQLPLIDRHIQLPFRPLLYSTPPRASPWQSEPTCQSAALIVHWDGFHFNAFLPPPPPTAPHPTPTHTHPSFAHGANSVGATDARPDRGHRSGRWVKKRKK